MIRALGDSPELSNISDRQLQDEVIATLLLHDMVKNGKGLNAQGFPFDHGVTGTHGVTLACKIADEGFNVDVNIKDSITRILTGIAGHMGIWTTDPEYRSNNIEDPVHGAFANLIHLADYCASRKVDDMYLILGDEKNG